MIDTKRKLLLVGVLAASVIAAAAAAIGAWQFRQINQMHAGRLLGTANALLTQTLNERIRHVEGVSAAIASNPGFVAYIAAALETDAATGQPADVASIRDQLDERRRESALAATAVLDANARTIAAAGDTFLSGYDYSALALAKEAKNTVLAASAIISDGGHLHVITITPLARAGVDASLMTAEKFDDASLRAISGISNTELALIAYAQDGPHVLTTTLGPNEAQAVLAQASVNQASWLGHAGARDTNQSALVIAGETWTTQIFPVPRTDRNAVLVALAAPTHSRAIAGTLWPPLAVAAIAGILLLSLLLFRYWRGTLGPIVAITGLAERAQRGDFALTFKAPGAGIAARLATALNQILAHLDRHRIPPGVPRRRATDSR